MKKMIIILFVIHLGIACKGQRKTDAKIDNWLGCWSVKSHFSMEIAALDEDDIAEVSNKKICIGKDHVSIFDEMSEAKFEIENANSIEYLKDNFYDKIKVVDLGIKSDSIQVLTYYKSLKTKTKNEKLTDGIEIFLSGNLLYYYLDGVIFILEKR